ncbi:MAG TPA: ABC-type transport auxiliary lipoprotein family protein [Candidatus Cloacimonadota bacterium]|nr:ABC-type transport auxiliary lipoprotein family protein [Candidatus Cloacimonadota bacterium]
MIKMIKHVSLYLLVLLPLVLGGCFGRIARVETNYYVLDYLKATERENLKQRTPQAEALEVWDTSVSRAYSRNQIVVKENNYRIRYLQNDLWATRLSESVPNLITQRLRAYNIFRKTDRDIGVQNPSHYLETSILNLEKREGTHPSAYLSMEFYLRDSASQRVLLTHKAETSRPLTDNSIVYLVQVFNEMIMQETDIFAARTIMLFEGREAISGTGTRYASPAARFYYEAIEAETAAPEMGELMLNLSTGEHPEYYYTIYKYDSEHTMVERMNALIGQPVQLEVGDYTVVVGENQDISIPVNIRARMRTVVDNSYWSELRVMIIDEGRNRVRMGYDIFSRDEDELAYELYSQGYSLDDESIGELDKTWILPAGHYMVKLGGGSWTDLKDFTTLKLYQGQSQVLTIVVNPAGERNFMVGAGVLNEDGILGKSSSIHRGAVHTNISLSQKNSTAQEDPINSFTLNAQFENNINLNQDYFEYNLRSLYDLGMSLSTGNDFRISQDGLSLKNTVLFTPFRNDRLLRNFGFYGRADLNTHLFDEILNFSNPRNVVMIDRDGDTLSVSQEQSSMRSRIALFPLRLKEGMGVTYRFVLSPKVSMSIRGGYGWQQDLNRRSFTFDRVSYAINDTLEYDVYKEDDDNIATGIESTFILSALNLFGLFSINSSFDVLFPMIGDRDNKVKYESDNRLNIRLFRNISLDLKANIRYDTANNDYVLYDYSSFLRLSLFY